MHSAIIVRVVIVGGMLTLTALLFATTAPQSAAGKPQHYRIDESMHSPPVAIAAMGDDLDAADSIDGVHATVSTHRDVDAPMGTGVDDLFVMQLNDGTEVARPRSPFELGDERVVELQSMKPLAVVTGKPTMVKSRAPMVMQGRPGRSAGTSPWKPVRPGGERGIGQFKSQQMYVPFAGRDLFKSKNTAKRKNQFGQLKSKDNQFYRPWWR